MCTDIYSHRQEFLHRPNINYTNLQFLITGLIDYTTNTELESIKFYLDLVLYRRTILDILFFIL